MAKKTTSKPPSRAAAQPLASRFFDRFAGLGRAHGRFELTGKQKGAKVEGRAYLIKAPPTVEAWREHLEGSAGLGIVPIRDDATCRFGAIDVDVYQDLDLAEIAKRIAELRFPLIVCRSKSGGAHLYCFGKEDLPADLLRKKLMEMAVALGHSGVEIFPKQASLGGERDFGNWLNMPYFAGDVTQRWAVGVAGGQLSAHQFLALADERAVTEVELRNLEPNADQFFNEGPPCLQALATRGFPEGSRNNALYNMAVYLRKREGEAGWDQKLAELNQRFMRPVLSAQEVLGVSKSVRRKAYEYKCKEQPICEACSREICLSRTYGVKGGRTDPGVAFGELVKIPTEPPIYLWDVNGERLELTSAQLMDQRQFNKVCFERLDVWPNAVRPNIWQDLVRERLGQLETLDAPEEASRRGRVYGLLEDFCTSRAHGRAKDELLSKKPWTEEGWTYFRLSDFLEFLEHRRIYNLPEREAWMMLRQHGCRHGRWNIKGKNLKWWAVPAFETVAEPLSVPRVPESEI